MHEILQCACGTRACVIGRGGLSRPGAPAAPLLPGHHTAANSGARDGRPPQARGPPPVEGAASAAPLLLGHTAANSGARDGRPPEARDPEIDMQKGRPHRPFVLCFSPVAPCGAPCFAFLCVLCVLCVLCGHKMLFPPAALDGSQPQATTTGILPILACHSFGPVWCTLLPRLSTATVTGMSCTSNS